MSCNSKLDLFHHMHVINGLINHPRPINNICDYFLSHFGSVFGQYLMFGHIGFMCGLTCKGSNSIALCY